MEKNKSQFNTSLLYIFIYVPLGAVCPLLSQYLASIGFTGTQVGIVTSCATGAAVLGGLVMGKLYANAKSKKLVVAIMFVLAAIASLTLLSIKTFILFTLIYSFLYFFQGPSHGLCDSFVIHNGQNFAQIRAFGAIGYALSSFVAGLISESRGLKVIFIIHACAFLIATLILLKEKEPPTIEEEKEKVKARDLFKDKGFVKLLIFSFFVLGTIMGNNTYFGYLYREAGGDVAGIGLAFLLMAGSEAIFMSLLPLVKKWLPTEKILPIGVLVAALRFGMNALGPSTGVLLGTFFLQGMMDGIILVEIVHYFEKIVEPRYSNISVSTYYALGNNLSAIVCNLLGGIILDAFSAKAVFLFFSILNVIALIIYFSVGLNRPKKIS